MHCPRCMGAFFHDTDTPYRIMCGTCGLLGRFELKGRVEFVPVVPSSSIMHATGSWNHAMAMVYGNWERHINGDLRDFQVLEDHTGQYSWCHATQHTTRASTKWWNSPSLGWGPPVKFTWGKWGNPLPEGWRPGFNGGSPGGWYHDNGLGGWSNFPDNVGECTVHGLTNVVDDPLVTMTDEEYEEQMEKAKGWFNKTLAERKSGAKGVPTTNEDSREGETSKGPEGRATQSSEETTARGLQMRNPGGSDTAPGQAESTGEQGATQVPGSDWCI